MRFTHIILAIGAVNVATSVAFIALGEQFSPWAVFIGDLAFCALAVSLHLERRNG